MTFKEHLKADIKVFTSIEEYGEVARLNDELIKAVIIARTSENQRKDTTSSGNGISISTNLHGVNLIGDYVELRFGVTDYKKKVPQQSEFVMLNGRKYRVETSSVNEGLVTLILTADRMQTPKPRLRGVLE